MRRWDLAWWRRCPEAREVGAEFVSEAAERACLPLKRLDLPDPARKFNLIE